MGQERYTDDRPEQYQLLKLFHGGDGATGCTVKFPGHVQDASFFGQPGHES